MRTKTLALSVALGVAGMVGTYAQVYSVNAVGYVNVTIPANGFSMIANPLDAGTGNNTASKLFANVPAGTFVYKFINGSYEQANGLDEFGEWVNPNQDIPVGQGVFIKTPAGSAVTITFVGEVAQGTASNKQLVSGFNMTGSMVPQAGRLATDLGYVPTAGDFIYKFNSGTQAYEQAYSFDEFGEWTPSEPTLAVGEAVFIKAASAKAWNRNFSVN